jgi:LmbE family N-acetylglucosaminyl deacetylase
MAASPRDHAGNPLCLLAVHAHPDDEASKGAGTVAKYTAEGIRCVLVCCTGGEAGDILNPAADTPDVRDNLAEVRMAELRASVEAIGYASLHLLGYHDSGMPETETNARPDNFANAPLDEAVGRLVAIIRDERPQVIVTYADDREFYPHPDHIRVHEISGPAFDAVGDADRFPESGEPWQPSKMYYMGWSKRRVLALHEAYLAHGHEPVRALVRVRLPGRRRPVHDARRRRRVPRPAPGRAPRPPHTGRPGRILDEAARRGRPGHVPMGGVRAGSIPGRGRRARRPIRRARDRSLRRDPDGCGDGTPGPVGRRDRELSGSRRLTRRS